MKNMLKDAAILFAITLTAGLILGGVYELTKAPIAESEARAKKEAFQECFPEMKEVTPIEESAQAGADTELSDDIMIAFGEAGEQLGYIFTVTTHEAYAGDIKITVGIKLDGTVTGVSILNISETPGLGMKAGEVLVPQFADKKVEQFEYTKTGAASEQQIDAISGATITTNAMTNAVNKALSSFEQIQKKGGASS